MARSLYLEDGSTEYIFAGETESGKLQQIIREKLGLDCEALYKEILEELTEPETGDDFEKIADGYLAMLNSTVDELDAILKEFNKPRLNRQKVYRALKQARDSLYNNL